MGGEDRKFGEAYRDHVGCTCTSLYTLTNVGHTDTAKTETTSRIKGLKTGSSSSFKAINSVVIIYRDNTAKLLLCPDIHKRGNDIFRAPGQTGNFT